MLAVVQNENNFSTLIEKLNLVAYGLNQTLPSTWKQSVIIPMLKQGKPRPTLPVQTSHTHIAS